VPEPQSPDIIQNSYQLCLAEFVVFIATCRIGTEILLMHHITLRGVYARFVFRAKFCRGGVCEGLRRHGRHCGPLAQRAHHGAACRFFHVEKILGKRLSDY